MATVCADRQRSSCKSPLAQGAAHHATPLRDAAACSHARRVAGLEVCASTSSGLPNERWSRCRGWRQRPRIAVRFTSRTELLSTEENTFVVDRNDNERSFAQI